MLRKQSKKKQKRYYKLIQRHHFDFLYENSPVELLDSASMFDIETFEYFLLFTFQNTGEQAISALEVTLLLYDGANIPYAKINYRYDRSASPNGAAGKGEVFGGDCYIPLPHSYYKRLEIVIQSVTFENGTTVPLSLSSARRAKPLSSLPKDQKAAYDSLNIYEGIEKEYPAILLPAVTQTAWLCCCGAKNLISAGFCARCKREKAWQLSSLSEEGLSRENRRQARERSNSYAHRRKADFLEKKTAVRDENAEDKRKLADLAIQKVLEQEKKKEKMKLAILPRIALYFLLMYLLYFLLRWLFG